MTGRAARPAPALVLLAAAALPGCIAVVGGETRVHSDDVETPTGESLSKLERRMDRIEERLPK